MEIKFDEITLSFHVEYGRGKKMKLLGTPEGHLTLKVPTHTSEHQIFEFMNANKKQLLTYYHQINSRQVIAHKKNYQTDELYLVDGKAVPLTTILDVIPSTDQEIQSALKHYYTKKTREIIKNRVKYYEKRIGVTAKSITIVDSRTTWGTCNHKKELTFNYKLSIAPIAVIDYVVIHELVHILHLNHDRSFWRKVGSFDTNYKQHEDYLKQFGHFMTV